MAVAVDDFFSDRLHADSSGAYIVAAAADVAGDVSPSARVGNELVVDAAAGAEGLGAKGIVGAGFAHEAV